jgi:hypothetical protein
MGTAHYDRAAESRWTHPRMTEARDLELKIRRLARTYDQSQEMFDLFKLHHGRPAIPGGELLLWLDSPEGRAATGKSIPIPD